MSRFAPIKLISIYQEPLSGAARPGGALAPRLRILLLAGDRLGRCGRHRGQGRGADGAQKTRIFHWLSAPCYLGCYDFSPLPFISRTYRPIVAKHRPIDNGRGGAGRRQRSSAAESAGPGPDPPGSRGYGGKSRRRTGGYEGVPARGRPRSSRRPYGKEGIRVHPDEGRTHRSCSPATLGVFLTLSINLNN